MSAEAKKSNKNQIGMDLPTPPDALFTILKELDIPYEVFKHDPVFTVEEGVHLKAEIRGLHCRNLFLRDKKKVMYLVTAANETAIDLKKLEKLLGSARLSFGSAERLWQYLGIRPGSVTPFCAINDKSHNVNIIIDALMMEAEIINVHPLDNAMTISLSPQGLMKFFAHTGHQAQIVDLSVAAP